MLKVKDIAVNAGQVPGLPRNPRLIRDPRFEKLKRSITEFPEMLELREVIVFPHEGKYVAVAGNMRLLAARELGLKEVPVKILPDDFPIEKLKELAIKDNVAFGDDDLDILANEWTDLPLVDWGVELPDVETFTPNLDPETSQRKVTEEDIVRTREELENNFKDNAHNYLEVTCPNCADTFFINPN